MEEKGQDIFEIELKRRTRKKLIKYVVPIVLVVWLTGILLLVMFSDVTGIGIIESIGNAMPYSIIIIGLYISVAPFLWFMQKSSMRSKAYDEVVGELNETYANQTFAKGDPIEVAMIKPRDSVYGKFVLELQYEDADFYAELDKKTNQITIYAILKGKSKKYKVEDISKKEFCECYQRLR